LDQVAQPHLRVVVEVWVVQRLLDHIAPLQVEQAVRRLDQLMGQFMEALLLEVLVLVEI